MSIFSTARHSESNGAVLHNSKRPACVVYKRSADKKGFRPRFCSIVYRHSDVMLDKFQLQ